MLRVTYTNRTENISKPVLLSQHCQQKPIAFPHKVRGTDQCDSAAAVGHSMSHGPCLPTTLVIIYLYWLKSGFNGARKPDGRPAMYCENESQLITHQKPSVSNQKSRHLAVNSSSLARFKIFSSTQPLMRNIAVLILS